MFHVKHLIDFFAGKTLLIKENPSEIRIKFMKSLKTEKSAIRAIFWKRFRYDKKDYFVEIVNDSGVGEDFKLYTSYADSKNAGKTVTGTVIYQKP